MYYTACVYSVFIECKDYLWRICTGIHQFKSTVAKSVGNKLVRHDPIPPVATSIASEAHLLCFDEFQVPNPMLHLCTVGTIYNNTIYSHDTIIVLLIPYIVTDVKYSH